MLTFHAKNVKLVEMGPSRTERDRRQDVLDAAFERFSRYGFRNTSIEDIARTAGVSRPLVYQHFANKEAVLRELAAQLHDRALAEAAERLSTPGQDVVTQVGCALVAKLRIPVELIGASEHHDELMETSSRLAGDIASAALERYDALLHKRLAAARRAGDLPRRTDGMPITHLVRLLRESAGGIAQGALENPDNWQARLTALVRLILDKGQP